MASMNGVEERFTESNVGDEVDRILKSIHVNDFIVEKPTSLTQPEQTLASVDSQQRSIVSTKALNPANISPTIPPVTLTLAEFVASANPLLLTSSLREQLFDCIVDYLGVTTAGAILAPSSTPIQNGVLAFTQHQPLPAGVGCTVVTQGQSYPPHVAALLNATYGHSLDFDDTHAEASLHAGVTAISTALAEAEFQLRKKETALTSDEILLAILMGYEVTIRIGIALSTASYSRGFHNTPVAGIFGCVATLAVLRHLSANTIVHAFGLAGSKAAGSMQYLANGSHNKRLHTGFAAHDAFLCVSLAEAGVVGAEKIIEGDLGLLQGYTDCERTDVDWQRLIGDLGTKWEFKDNALKPYAGCRMTHGFIELADSLGKHVSEGKWVDQGVDKNCLDAIKKIKCIMPKANMILVGQKISNKVHPENTVDAQFSAYYQTANAVLFGGTHDMAAYAPERLKDEHIKSLSDKIDCVVDENMKGMSCRMEVFLQDSDGNMVEVVRREVTEPLGERNHPFARHQITLKFRGLLSQVCGDDKLRAPEILRLVGDITGDEHDARDTVLDLLDMLAKEPELN